MQLLVASMLSLPLAGGAHAQCVPFDQRVHSDNLDMFREDPVAALDNVRNDNGRIAGRIAGYIETDPKLLEAVRKLVAVFPTLNKPAIGAGLRRAQMQCTTAQEARTTREIENFVRNLGDRAVSAGYTAEAEQPDFDPAPSKTSITPKRDGGELLTDEYSTQLSDPFAKVPLPLLPDTPQ